MFFNFAAVGYATGGFAGRFRQAPALVQISQAAKLNPLEQLSTQDLPDQIQRQGDPPMATLSTEQPYQNEQYNYGLSVTCDTSFTLSPDC